MIKGFITMSARPFHKGHEALIDYAKENCDHLTIMISNLPDEVIPYKYRLIWILSTYLNDPKVNVLGMDIDEPTDLSYDELSLWWGKFVREKIGRFDRVFTSEPYGEKFAEAMGAQHWLFDQSRSNVKVSGTAIREKPLTNWDYINNFAKDYFTKKIAIVGTESTGKTVLAAQLAKHFNTEWCPELGREIVQSSEKTTLQDIAKIGVEHAKHIMKHVRLSNKILIVDTDLTITMSYSNFLFGEVPKFEPWVEKANEFDLYIYLEPTAPYVDDGTRFDLETRNRLAESHLKMFEERGITLHRFNFEGGMSRADAYEKRFNKIVEFIQNYINEN